MMLKPLALAFSITVFAATPVLTAENDEPNTADMTIVQNCLRGAGNSDTGKRACIGQISQACMRTPGGDTTLGMVNCAVRETLVWDSLLNSIYREILGRLEGKASTALRGIQRLWITWRDKKCSFAYVQYEGGTIAGPIASGCIMTTTAERAIELGYLLDEVALR